ncbi:PorT family protein [Formosa maritima]|uniref:PorT family protein n=1 Tax=Formosa maritima TaxID=2592046 RepID=A0A5D0G4D9_9FLAO|nr:PorT family protein [Formosa maritima]TYA53836.1 PorT family protein [Formosa maritima]
MFAQKNNTTTIKYSSGETKQFDKANLSYNSKDFIVGIETKSDSNQKLIIDLVGVTNVNFEGTSFIVKSYKKNPYLFEVLISGSISLYKSGEHYFLENNEDGFRELEKKVVKGLTLKTFNYATVSIYVNKCKEAQENAYNQYDSLTISNLKAIIETYNNCNLSEDTQFANNVITLANADKEFIEIAVNVGYNFLSTDFDELSSGVSNNFGTPVLGVQIYMNTNMFNKSLGFIAMVDYTFPNEFNSLSNNIYLNTETAYLSTMLGIRYTFNNISKSFSPYIGFNTGFLFNSMSYVTKQQNTVGAAILDFDTTNELTYNFSAGTYIKFGKQKIDFNLMYQPKINFGLESTDNLNRLESYYTVSGFQLKASYIF